MILGVVVMIGDISLFVQRKASYCTLSKVVSRR